MSSAYTFLLQLSWEWLLYLIIIIKLEVWITNHCIGSGHERMVYAVCLSMFFNYIYIFSFQFHYLFQIVHWRSMGKVSIGSGNRLAANMNVDPMLGVDHALWRHMALLCNDELNKFADMSLNDKLIYNELWHTCHCQTPNYINWMPFVLLFYEC